MVYYSWYTRRDEKPWIEQELGTFVRGVQVLPQRAGVSVTDVLLRFACVGSGGPAFRFMVSVPFSRRPVSVRLARGLGGRPETQVLNRRPVSLGLTKPLPVPALGEAVRRLGVTSGSESLHPTVRVPGAACSWLHTEVSTEHCHFPRSEDTSSCVRVASGSLLKNLGGARPSWGPFHCLLPKCWTLGVFACPVEHRVQVQLPRGKSTVQRQEGTAVVQGGAVGE